MKDRILNVLMLAAVAAALILTFLKGPPDTEAGLPMASVAQPAAIAPHPAEVYRARRKETRAMEQSLLTTLIDSEQTVPETKAMAEQQLIAITTNEEIYTDALCVSRDGSMTVFLPTEITAEEAAYFLEMAQDASGLPPENIRLTGY